MDKVESELKNTKILSAIRTIRQNQMSPNKFVENNSKNSIHGKNKNKSNQWDNYFCYINDKDREKLMELPVLPPKTSNKKTNLKYKCKSSKRLEVNNNKSIQDINKKSDSPSFSEEETEGNKKHIDKNNRSDDESEDEKISIDQKRKNLKKIAKVYNKEKTISFNSKMNTYKEENTGSEQPIFKPPYRNLSISRPEFSEVDFEAQLNPELIHTLGGNLQFNNTYKNLVRSMRSNL